MSRWPTADAELAAAEIVRRAERGIALAIRRASRLVAALLAAS